MIGCSVLNYLTKFGWKDVVLVKRPSNAAFSFLSIAEMEFGLAPAIACRITCTGDLGYEIYVSRDHQLALYEALIEVGADLDPRPFGTPAMM